MLGAATVITGPGRQKRNASECVWLFRFHTAVVSEWVLLRELCGVDKRRKCIVMLGGYLSALQCLYICDKDTAYRGRWEFSAVFGV